MATSSQIKRLAVQVRGFRFSVLGKVHTLRTTHTAHGWNAEHAARYSARFHRTVSAGKVTQNVGFGR